VNRSFSSPRRASAWIVLLVLLVAPLLVFAALWALSAMANPTASASRIEPVVVPVQHQDMRAQTTVNVTVTFSPGRDLVAYATGTVTSAARAGVTLNNGDVVLRVDDRPIRAMVADAPMWRSLSTGSKGDDVKRLKSFLHQMGSYDGTVDTTYDATLAQAVARFNRDGGYGGSTSFDPTTVIWVGPKPLAVAEVVVTAGNSINPGTAVARGPKQATSIAVQEPAGGIATAGDFSSGATLALGSASVSYEPGSGIVADPAAVAALEAAMEPADSGAATIEAARPTPVDVVPASALVTGPDGTTCVYASATSAPTVVQPVGGGVGTLQLPTSFPLDSVLANPGSAKVDRPCSS
jgi:hypothetical protein